MFALIEEALGVAAIPRGSIEVVAVGLGPGSYTGIRAAIAVAQGWHLATGVRLLGLRSTVACALQARRLGLRGSVAVVVDAQRGEFYVEEFDLTAELAVSCGSLRILDRAALTAIASPQVQLVGPEIHAQHLAGTEVHPTASALVELAEIVKDYRKPEELEPIYLRPTSFVKTLHGPEPLRAADLEAS